MNAKMPELKRCFEAAGFGDVKTVLATGNVVFSAPSKPNSKLEAKVAERAKAFAAASKRNGSGKGIALTPLDRTIEEVWRECVERDADNAPGQEDVIRLLAQLYQANLLHSDMAATIVVFDHPFYAVPSADGSFLLDHIPSGRYRLGAWHERIGESISPIEVKAGAAAKATFILPIDVQ